MLKSSDVHCNMKIQFCTSEGPVVYWIQVLGDQNLINVTIGNNIFFTKWAIQAHVILPSMCIYVLSSMSRDVRYDFRIKTNFGSSLPPLVYRRSHVVFTLYVFVWEYWSPTHIVLCFYFACHSSCIPYGVNSLDCPFLTVPSVTFVCTHHDKNSTVIITNWLKIIKYSFFK
jgi:hypothetical protein